CSPRLLERRLARDLVAPPAAVEEPVARAAEALPQDLRLRARQRPDALPLRLEALHGRRRALPVGRVGQRLGLLAERGLLPRVLAALGIGLLPVLLPAREEAVARLAELLPERARVPHRHGA